MINREMLLNGLLLYTQIRDWAFEKMNAVPRGSTALDLEVPQYLFVSNALASSDLVGETYYGRNFRTPAYETDYERSIIFAFGSVTSPAASVGGREAYAYVRELRNSVVHRGLGSAMSGEANERFVFALCPAGVRDSSGKNTYQRPWKYMLELATAANQAFNSVMYAELEKHNFFDVAKWKIHSLTDAISEIQASNEMPNWAKTMALESLAKRDYSKFAKQMLATRLDDMKSHLGVI
jgi:L-rhamnose mutarotase